MVEWYLKYYPGKMYIIIDFFKKKTIYVTGSGRTRVHADNSRRACNGVLHTGHGHGPPDT